jgi:hypothetical protein
MFSITNDCLFVSLFLCFLLVFAFNHLSLHNLSFNLNVCFSFFVKYFEFIKILKLSFLILHFDLVVCGQ